MLCCIFRYCKTQMQYAAAVSLWWPVNKHGCRHFAHLMKYLATENDTAVHKTTVQYIHRCLEKSGLSLGETFFKNVKQISIARIFCSERTHHSATNGNNFRQLNRV